MKSQNKKQEKNEYRKMPKPIDTSPEELARIILTTPPKNQRQISSKTSKD